MNIIIKPLISEKSLREAQNGKYTFLVKRTADKTTIRKAIEVFFKVHVTGITTNIVKKTKTRNTRKARKTTDIGYKKARVTLLKDEKIDIFEEKSDDKNKKK